MPLSQTNGIGAGQPPKTVFRPDVVKISLESEEVERRREAASTRPVAGPSKQGAACDAAVIGGRPLTTGGSV
jgi:hypothetical protein